MGAAPPILRGQPYTKRPQLPETLIYKDSAEDKEDLVEGKEELALRL